MIPILFLLLQITTHPIPNGHIPKLEDGKVVDGGEPVHLNDAINTAVADLEKFAFDHKLNYSLGRDHSGAPFTAKLSITLDPDSPDWISWSESNYPDPLAAVHAIEADFTKYPKGYVGKSEAGK